jgi:hypothetical protein
MVGTTIVTLAAARPEDTSHAHLFMSAEGAATRIIGVRGISKYYIFSVFALWKRPTVTTLSRLTTLFDFYDNRHNRSYLKNKCQSTFEARNGRRINRTSISHAYIDFLSPTQCPLSVLSVAVMVSICLYEKTSFDLDTGHSSHFLFNIFFYNDRLSQIF